MSLRVDKNLPMSSCVKSAARNFPTLQGNIGLKGEWKMITEENNKVDRDELEKLLLEIVDCLERRHNKLQLDDFDLKVQRLALVCSSLWKEKEGWKEMYYNMYKRYSDHLDKEISELNEMLPRRRTL